MIRGTVQSVLFQNPENGYSVLKLRTEDGELVTVVGTIPMTIVGERLVIAGRWGHHPSHGPQFEAEFLERLMPETKAEIFSFLSSRAVKGIGAKTAEKIVSRFGASSLDVLENEPERLTEIPGITEKKAREMSESFRRQSGIRRLIEFLTAHRLPPELAVRLYRVYGELATDALRDDPYVLTDPYFHADFSLVDAFALELDVAADDERQAESFARNAAQKSRKRRQMAGRAAAARSTRESSAPSAEDPNPQLRAITSATNAAGSLLTRRILRSSARSAAIPLTTPTQPDANPDFQKRGMICQLR